jgi:hypothetical protein
MIGQARPGMIMGIIEKKGLVNWVKEYSTKG